MAVTQHRNGSAGEGNAKKGIGSAPLSRSDSHAFAHNVGTRRATAEFKPVLPDDTYAELENSLKALEPHLAILPILSNAQPETYLPVIAALESVICAAESYQDVKKGRRGKDGRNAEDVRKADSLDAQAILLWTAAQNSSAKAAKDVEEGVEEHPKVAAMLRVCSLRLIQAATDSKLISTQLIARNLHVVCKTISALTKVESAKREVLQGLLAAGGDYEKSLSDTCDLENQKDAAILGTSMVEFCIAKVDAAMLYDGNSDVAMSFIRGLIDGTSVPIRASDYQLLASACWKAGDSLRMQLQLTPSGATSLADPVLWLQLGLAVVEKSEQANEGAHELQDVKIALLRSLARAFLVRSTNEGLEEVGSVLDSMRAHNHVYEHELALIQLHLAVRNSTSPGSRNEILSRLIQHTEWKEQEIIETIREIYALTGEEGELWQAVMDLLKRAMGARDGQQFVGVILITILVSAKFTGQATKDPKAVLDIGLRSLNCIASYPNFVFPRDEKAIACESVLWGLAANEAGKEGQEHIAAELFLLAGHPVLCAGDSNTLNRSRRKAAMCYIKAKDFDRARQVLGQCNQREAATQYVTFLAAAEQGQVDMAINAINDLAQCPDLTSEQLILLTALAHDRKLHQVVRHSLDALLSCMIGPGRVAPSLGDSIVLVRALVKMTLQDIADVPVEEKATLCTRLAGYYEKAVDLMQSCHKLDDTQARAVSWLYESAYNATYKYCDELPADLVTGMYKDVVALVAVHEAGHTSGRQPALVMLKAKAAFTAFCGEMSIFRGMPAGNPKAALLEQLATGLVDVGDIISTVDCALHEKEPIEAMTDILSVMEAELLFEKGDWNAAVRFVKDLKAKSSQSNGALQPANSPSEAIADLICKYPTCPAGVAAQILLAIVNDMNMRTDADVVKYARWTRFTLDALLRSGIDQDENAYGLVEGVCAALQKAEVGQAYPAEELQWLVAKVKIHAENMSRTGPGDVADAWVWLQKDLAGMTQ